MQPNNEKSGWIEKLRDLVGSINLGFRKRRFYRRFEVGDSVYFYNSESDKDYWDEGEVIYTMNKDKYYIRDPDGKQHLVNWEDMQPKKTKF